MILLWASAVLGSAIILQTTVFSRVTMIQGSVDIVLLCYLSWVLRREAPGGWLWGLIAGLVVGFSSALPVWLPIGGYLLTTAGIKALKTRIWQVPLFALFSITLISTVLLLGLQWIFLAISGSPINIGDAFNLVILPSVVLNLIAAFPIYTLIGEFFQFLYPEEEEA
jgi:hypothetical protein